MTTVLPTIVLQYYAAMIMLGQPLKQLQRRQRQRW